MKKTLILSMLSVFLLVACMGGKQENSVELTESGLNPQKFVTDVDGKKTGLYILRNKNNMEVCMGHRTKRILRIERKEYQTY